ncbi:MAG: hypothetical protein AB7Q29_19185 [Vicinamibacterales bacterium]
MPWCPGDLATWRPGDLATWRPGEEHASGGRVRLTRSRPLRVAAACFVCALLGSPWTCEAQPSTQPSTISAVLTFLVTSESVDTGNPERDRSAALATSATISRALLTTLATLPVTSTSGAFQYRLNPDIGTVERATRNFGPLFVQRALTVGSGTAGIGLSYQHLRLTALDGRNLRNGTLVTTANRFTDEADPFDLDQLTLNIDADIATLYGNVGLGNRVEIGAAAPLVSLRIDGTRVNTYRGRTFTQARASGQVFGLADVLTRAKVTIFEEAGASLAGAVDLRLPTGRREDLLGAGKASTRITAIGSLEGEQLSGHANLGVALGGLADEVIYGAALTGQANERVTMNLEILGRWIDTPGSVRTVSAPHATLSGIETLRLVPGTDRLQTLTLTPGVKWNLGDTWVLVAHVGMPLMRGGLRAPLLPFIGLDYSIGR